MKESTYYELHDYFKPHNEHLRALLRDELREACVVGFEEEGDG
jgi:hypothetical protein